MCTKFGRSLILQWHHMYSLVHVCAFFIVHSENVTPIMLLHYLLTLLPLRFFSLAICPIAPILYLHKYIYSSNAAASARVKWLGINRQVIWLEQSLSNQMWQTVFKRLFSSIKQAACLCQLRVWKKTIQLKRPCMFAHTLAHTHTHSYAAPTWSILYCFFFLLFVSVCFFCV